MCNGRMTPLFPAPLSISPSHPPLTAASLHSRKTLHIYPCLRPVPTPGPSYRCEFKLASHFGNIPSIQPHTELLVCFVGYSSGAAGTVLAGLGERVGGAEESGGDSFEGVHFRTLGDVGYLMTSFKTPGGTVRALEQRVLDCLSNKHST